MEMWDGERGVERWLGPDPGVHGGEGGRVEVGCVAGGEKGGREDIFGFEEEVVVLVAVVELNLGEGSFEGGWIRRGWRKRNRRIK